MTVDDDRGLSAQRRRDRIRELVTGRRYVGVADLSARFGVSEVTVRTDLEHLEEAGAIDRVRGGAIGSRTALENTFAHQLGSHAEEKEAIGRVAADILGDSESVFIDSGTTTTAVARALVHSERELTGMVIVTNSLPVALELEDGIPPLQVVVTGGTLRPRQHSLVDPMADVAADHLHVDTTIIGCTGIDPVAGVTNSNMPESPVKQRWLSKAARIVLVADGSKLGATTLARICPVADVDLVITGVSAPPEVVQSLRELGVSVIVAE